MKAKATVTIKGWRWRLLAAWALVRHGKFQLVEATLTFSGEGQ